MHQASGAFEAAAEAGRQAWPTLHAREPTFRDQLAEKVDLAEQAAGTRIHPADLYLACACSVGDQEAMRIFEERFGRVLDRAVSRFAHTDDGKSELKQMLRERLFVAPPGRPPRIASYSGHGFLENWLRVAAVRACVNASVGKDRERPTDEAAFQGLVDNNDLELDFLKSHYRAEFKQAFARAAEKLEPEERLLLRLSVLQQMSCDEVAATLGVHRATAARRTARARQLLVEHTRGELAGALRLDAAELTSVLALVESNLDLSVSRLLAVEEDGA